MTASHSILFVCQANVCRSPMMEFTFAQALRTSGAVGWHVSSAGVTALAGATACSLIPVAADDAEAARIFRTHHTSRALSERMLTDSQLIVAASRMERGRIAALDPGVRRRAFTLGEAVRLADEPLSDSEAEAVMPGSLSDVVAVMNARRARSVGGVAGESDDATDFHHLRRRKHLTALVRVGDLTARLRSHLLERLSEADGRHSRTSSDAHDGSAST